MPVYYRETAVDRPPTFDPRGTVPHQTQQQSLLQPQLSAGSSLTGTTIVSPSESTCIFGVNDPRGTQSEGDGSEFGTWLSASHLGTPQMAKVPPSQSQFVASQQRMPSVAKHNGQPQSQMPHFPMEVRVQQSGDTQQSQDAGEVSRRSERWSREEFYPPAGSERMPGAPFHKVTKEDYVIEQVVESSPKLVTTTRIVYPSAQQQPLGAQPQTQQIPRQQQNQPKGQWQAKPEQQQQQQRKIQPQQDGQAQQQQQQRQPPPQVPFKTQQQKVAQPTQPPQQQQQYSVKEQPQKQQQYTIQQQPQQHEQYPMQQQLKQQQQAQQMQQYSMQQQLQQPVQPVQQVQKHQNFAQQHQYVHQQVQFQQPQQQQQYEHPQHATEREQHQQAQQYVMKQQQQTQQKQPQRVQIVGQTQLGQIEQQQQRGGGGQQPEQQQKQAVAGQQQQQLKENGQAKQQPKQGQFGQEEEQAVQQAKEQQKWNKQHQNEQYYQIHVQKQQQQQQIEVDEIGEKVKQKQRTMPQMGETEESAEDDEPPPQMQLAEAPEELIQRQKSVGEGDGSVSPERQKHRKHVMVNSPWYRQNAEFEQQKYQDFRNYAEPLYVCPDFPADGSVCQFDDSQQKSPEHKYYYQHFQPQQRVHQYFSPSSVKWDSVYEDEFPDGQPPPFAHGPGSPYEYLLYHQKVNLDRRRAESEQRRRHHSPVPGAAEHGYKFGGMDFVDHIEFNPYSDVGEPFDERQSRRDLHTGPPRRRGDFYGLDYTTMLPDGQWRQPSEWEAEDAQNYHGYQALPPRKNFRLCGRYTADPDAPLNIAEADGLDELNSDYLVGNTLANQRCVTDRELTDEEKRTFALLYGPGGFKPDHVTIRPDPLPEEPPVFSTTIGPQKSRSAADISPTPQGYVNPMKVEGESWMLGRRSEQGNYGLASSGEQPPFVRPARFPPHVPQWAKDRQFSMTRGAKSVDRSLFAPSWAKVPQPQPPYWVKRTEDGKGVGAVQKGKAWEEEEKEKHDEMGKEQRVGAVQTQQQQQPRQPTQQQMEQQMVKLQQNQLKQSQQTQGQRIGQTEQLMPKQNQMQQQFRAVQQQKAQQSPQQFEYEKGIMQKTTVVTTVEITEEPQEDNQPQEEQQRVGAVQQKNEQKQWPINRQQQQVKQQQRPQQQQIATTKTNATATAENIANGTPKDGQTQQWRQQQQQPTRQVQAVQQQIEKMPTQQRAFDKPGGMYYFHEKRTEDKKGEKETEKQTEQRIVTKQQQQQKVPSTEASSGLENLKMPKLGEFPALPDVGKRFTGPTEQQMVRHRNAPPQQQPKEGQAVRQQMPKFPTGRRWSKEPQEGDVFVDGFGRPVHYVREMVVDPRTGEAVTREEWRLADERRTEEEGQNGDSLPANSSRHFRQQIITKSTQNSVKQ
ncbi:hypothetical protein niasHT_034571 [Heterodera trifolii]|uniref:Uncharacterized protein n=1 Tax=Heterodera trifolii TaxID=157864 RepID=A0ABD2J318_9BILA